MNAVFKRLALTCKNVKLTSKWCFKIDFRSQILAETSSFFFLHLRFARNIRESRCQISANVNVYRVSKVIHALFYGKFLLFTRCICTFSRCTESAYASEN